MNGLSKEDLIAALASMLKPLHFKKRRATWHRRLTDTIQVINVQGSQWGPEYYLNVGTYLRALGAEVAPPEFHCHIRARIHHPERPAAILLRECEEWFEQLGNMDVLLEHAKHGTLPLLTTGAARQYLDAIAHGTGER